MLILAIERSNKTAICLVLHHTISSGPYVTQDKTAKHLSTGPLLCHISYNLYFFYQFGLYIHNLTNLQTTHHRILNPTKSSTNLSDEEFSIFICIYTPFSLYRISNPAISLFYKRTLISCWHFI